MIVTDHCQGSNWKEVAYVEAPTSNPHLTESFTYYIDVGPAGNKTRYYVGSKNKNQTSTVYTANANPIYIYVNDPSYNFTSKIYSGLAT